MLTTLKAIELSTEYLNKKGVPSSRINAELLLAHVLKSNRMNLYLKFDQPLADEEIENYRNLISRRAKREPLQYIIGSVEFYGLQFYVDKNVLIPRQETELLIETILLKYNSNAKLKILDIGTGSGNIAITLAKYLPNSSILSIDVDQNALDLAKKNVELNKISGNLDLLKIDLFKIFDSKIDTFDVIISNPPYISIKDYRNLEPELLNFEPKVALTDDNDGLSFYRFISENAKFLLNKGGEVFFEIGFQQSINVKNLLLNNSFKDIEVKKDYADIDRIIIGKIL